MIGASMRSRTTAPAAATRARRCLAPSRLILALSALLAAGCCLLPATSAAATAVPNLTGTWLDSSYILTAYQLQTTAGGKLTATWNANEGNVSEGLVGRFTGTLSQAGTAYTGHMNVSVGSISVGGTMTIAIATQEKSGHPELDLSYRQSNGVTDSFTLEYWLAPLTVTPGPNPSISFEYYCPGPKSCQQQVEAAQSASMTGVVGSLRFTVPAGHSHLVKLALDPAGRKLLVKRRSLHLHVELLGIKTSSSLPYRTILGTVALRA